MKRTKKINMTESSVDRSATTDGKTRLVLKDKKTMGLYLVVGTTGLATWYYRQRINGRDNQRRLGVYRPSPAGPIIMTLDAARDEVRRVLVARGEGGEREYDRQLRQQVSIPTLEQLGNDWLTDNPRGLTDRTMANMRSLWRHLEPLYAHPITEITPEAVERLRIAVRDAVSARTGYGIRTSNKAVEFLGQLIDRAIKLNKIQMANPARDEAVQKQPDRRKRKVFLKGSQRGEFIAVLNWYRELPERWQQRSQDWLDAAIAAGAYVPDDVRRRPADCLRRNVVENVAERHPVMRAWVDSFEREFGWSLIARRHAWRHNQLAADALWTALLTGARIGNILRMKWEDIDEDWVWTIPAEETKTREEYHIPLEPTVLVPMLKERRGTSPWVFPSPDTGEPVQSLKKSWQTIKVRAGLSDLRIHDLRRTMGSVMFNLGQNQRQIQMALCHSDPKATEHYTWLEDDSVLRANFTAAAQAMMGD